MDERSVIEYVRSQLGSPTVEVELTPEDIRGFLSKAIEKAKPYSTQTDLLQKSEGPVIDLTQDRVIEVVRVYEAPGASRFSMDVDPFVLRQVSSLTMSMVDVAVWPYRRRQIESIIDKNFRFIDGNLYVDDYSGPLVVEVIRDWTLEELREEYLKDWIQEYTLALAKVALGEKRRKFTVAGAPFSLDGEMLVSEGLDRQRELEEKLVNDRGFFMVEQ